MAACSTSGRPSLACSRPQRPAKVQQRSGRWSRCLQVQSLLSNAPKTEELLKAASSSGKADAGLSGSEGPSAGAATASDSDASVPHPRTATLLVKCTDQKGVVASLAQLLYGFGCNIVSSDQFSDVEANMFYQRIQFDYSDLIVGPGNTAVLERGIAEVANKYSMEWKVSYSDRLKRVAVLVSKLDHCLYDLLIRRDSGELPCDIPVVISNHPDLEGVASKFNIPFRHLPLAPRDAASKAAQEAQIEKILEEMGVDLIVLARYMQIFSPEFCEKHWRHTINIHHSFLPSFSGAKPYHRAHDRGVKVIGATAHYATAELDCGPIIDQGVTRVTHRDAVGDMVRKGRDLERLVLARAVRWHLEDRVIVHGNKTVVFED